MQYKVDRPLQVADVIGRTHCGNDCKVDHEIVTLGKRYAKSQGGSLFYFKEGVIYYFGNKCYSGGGHNGYRYYLKNGNKVS